MITVLSLIKIGYYFKYDGELYLKTDCYHAMSVLTPGPDKKFSTFEGVMSYENQDSQENPL